MKTILVLLILTLPAPGAAAGRGMWSHGGAQAASANQAEQAEAGRLNAEVLKLFTEGKYDEALPLAKRVLEIRERAGGSDEMALAYALVNLASLYARKGKDGEAEPLFRRALSIVEKRGEETDFAAGTNTQLGLLRLNARDYKGAAPFLQRALDIRQKLHGADDLSLVHPLLNLTDLHTLRDERAEARVSLDRAVSILRARPPTKDPATAARLKPYLCRLAGLNTAEDKELAGRVSNAIWRMEEPESAARYEQQQKEKEERAARGKEEMEIVQGGVLNGRAVSKPAPVYPREAKQQGIMGAVIVKITVDEAGKVVKAEAVCGHPLLAKAAVDAAGSARFTPTLLSGMPVKVAGIITYNFVLQ